MVRQRRLLSQRGLGGGGVQIAIDLQGVADNGLYGPASLAQRDGQRGLARGGRTVQRKQMQGLIGRGRTQKQPLVAAQVSRLVTSLAGWPEKQPWLQLQLAPHFSRQLTASMQPALA